MKYSPLLMSSLMVLALSACAADPHGMKDPIDSMQGMKSARERRLATAAAGAIAEGKIDEALPLFERRYGKEPENRDVALNYAQLLRKTGRADRAQEVLTPFVEKNAKKKDGLLLNEYAAALLETGQIESAQNVLNAVIADAALKEFHADAKNQLGISYAAQNRHGEAEILFREAWEAWRGDATSVMNNLGLAQANQGKYDAALLTLRRALALAPHKTEIARNIDIVDELRAHATAKPPAKIAPKKPVQKTVKKTAPKAVTAAEKKPAKEELPPK